MTTAVAPRVTSHDRVDRTITTVTDLANDVAARLPEAAAGTRSALVEAERRMRDGSDAVLSAGATLTFGFAFGALVSGANRYFVALALLPAAAMSMTLLGRRPKATRD